MKIINSILKVKTGYSLRILVANNVHSSVSPHTNKGITGIIIN